MGKEKKTELEIFKSRIKGYFISFRWNAISDIVGKPAKNIQRLFDECTGLKFDIYWLVIFRWVLKRRQNELNKLIEDIDKYLEDKSEF